MGSNEIYFIQPILGGMLYLAPDGLLLAENENLASWQGGDIAKVIFEEFFVLNKT